MVMLQKIKEISRTPMLRYFLYSVVVTVLDTVIVWVLYRVLHLNLVTSNSIGVITGFLVHYVLSSKSVFQEEYGITGFVIYFSTFLFGLAFADGLIYIGEHYLFDSLSNNLSFLMSKGLSILIPFFLLYFIRKFLFDLLKKNYVMHS